MTDNLPQAVDIRKERHEFTRQAILNAALVLITQHGLHNLSLREIARQVGYSPAGLYKYFDSKEAIIQALSDEGDGLLNDRLAQVPSDLPADGRLVALGLAYIDFARTQPEYFQLMFSELTTRRTSLNDPVQEDKPYYFVAKAVQEGIDQALFQTQPGYDVGEITYGLWSLVHGAAMLQLRKLRGHQDDFSGIDRVVLHTFVQGLGKRNES
jgi:AcrR family transcriptional regulator